MTRFLDQNISTRMYVVTIAATRQSGTTNGSFRLIVFNTLES